jgi:uncharacterized protein
LNEYILSHWFNQGSDNLREGRVRSGLRLNLRLSKKHMQYFTLYIIRFYQRYISPYKGFSCAYHYHTGHVSCSALGFRAIQRYGIIDGMLILRMRLYLCGVSHRRYSRTLVRPHRSQRGDCDIGCDFPFDSGCDMQKVKSCRILDALSCVDACSCDWPSNDKKNKKREEGIHLPPKLKR